MPYLEVIAKLWQEVPLGSGACLHVVGASVPELGEGGVAHQELLLGRSLLDQVPNLKKICNKLTRLQ